MAGAQGPLIKQRRLGFKSADGLIKQIFLTRPKASSLLKLGNKILGSLVFPCVESHILLNGSLQPTADW